MMRSVIVGISCSFFAAAFFITALTITATRREGEHQRPGVTGRAPEAPVAHRQAAAPPPPPADRPTAAPTSPSPPPGEDSPEADPPPLPPPAPGPSPGIEFQGPVPPPAAETETQNLEPFPIESGEGERGRVIALLGGGLFPPGSEGRPEELLLAVRKALPEIVLSPSARIVVAGHTDSTPTRSGPGGKYADNRVLSLQRAEAVARLLVREGVDAEKIFIAGHGDSRPLAPNSLEEGREENRRVEIRLVTGRDEAETARGAGE